MARLDDDDDGADGTTTLFASGDKRCPHRQKERRGRNLVWVGLDLGHGRRRLLPPESRHPERAGQRAALGIFAVVANQVVQMQSTLMAFSPGHDAACVKMAESPVITTEDSLWCAKMDDCCLGNGAHCFEGEKGDEMKCK
jgi:hypothetical protein